MYYSGDVTKFLETNTAIIGKRDSGKTTILKKLIKHCYENGYTIMLFDSVTDHAAKSILLDTLEKYDDNFIITSPGKEEISFNLNSVKLFPFNLLRGTNYRIYSFDVSKYLEEGYDTDDLEERSVLRLYYKQLVVQELSAIYSTLSLEKCIVIMDEIELIPDSCNIIQKLNSKGVNVITALHVEESLSTARDSFEKIYLD